MVQLKTISTWLDGHSLDHISWKLIKFAEPNRMLSFSDSCVNNSALTSILNEADRRASWREDDVAAVDRRSAV